MEIVSIHGYTRVLGAAFALVLALTPRLAAAQGACNPDTSLNPVDELQTPATELGVTGQLNSWKSARENCKNANHSAQIQCTEACSPSAQQTIAGLNNGAANTPQQSSNGAANNQANNLTNATNGINTTKAACTSTKSDCESKCKSASSAGDQLASAAQGGLASCIAKAPTDPSRKGTCQGYVTQIKNAVQKDNAESPKGPTVAGKAGQCKGELSSNLADLLKMLADLLNMLMQAQKTGDETAATMDPVASASVDCSLPENQQKQDCICKRDPRTPGCPNNLTKAGDGAGFSSLSGDAVNLPVTNGNPAATLPSEGPVLPGMAGGMDAGGGQGMLGGGMGGMGGGGSPGGKDDKAAGPAGSGLKADVYSGDGMGGSGGGGGSWASSSDTRGGARKPTAAGARGASGLNPSKYVTGPGGRTNWEKVKIRYGENRPTFLNE